MSATVVGSIKSILSLDSSNFMSGLRGVSRELYRTKTGASLAFGAIKLGAAAAAAALVYSTKQAANFADKMSDVAIVAKGSGMTVESLKKEILGMSAELGDASKRAEAFRVAITTGMRDMESATEAANVGAKLAVALNADQEQAVRLVAGAMNAYKNATGDATLSLERLGDMLVQTIRLGDITGQQLVQTLGKVTPMFGEMNVPIEQLLASMVELTKAQVRPFEAATQLRAILNQMLKPSGELKKRMDDIRISTDGTTESFTSATELIGEKGLIGVFSVLNHLTDEQKDKLGELVPNIRALAGAMKLSGSGLKDYMNTLERYKDIEDGLDDAFKTKDKTLRTTWNLFKDMAVILGDPTWIMFKDWLDDTNAKWLEFNKWLTKDKTVEDILINVEYVTDFFMGDLKRDIAYMIDNVVQAFSLQSGALTKEQTTQGARRIFEQQGGGLRTPIMDMDEFQIAKIYSNIENMSKTYAESISNSVFGLVYKGRESVEEIFGTTNLNEMRETLMGTYSRLLADMELATDPLVKKQIESAAEKIFSLLGEEGLSMTERKKLARAWAGLPSKKDFVSGLTDGIKEGTDAAIGEVKNKEPVIDSIFDFEEKSITSKFTDRLTSVYDNAITESGYYIDSKNIKGKERMLAKTLGMTEKDYLDMRLNNRPKLEAMYDDLIAQAQKKVDEMSKKINIGQAIVGNIKATTDMALDSLVGWGELLGKKIDEEIDRISGKISGLESRISTTAAEIERLKSELGIDDKPKTISDMRQELKEKLELMAEMHDLELVGMQEFEEGKYELALAVYEDNKDLLDQEMQDEIDQLEQTLSNEEEKARAALATAEAKMAADKLELESEKKKLKEQEKEKEKHLKKMNALDFVAFMAEKATKISEIVFNAAIAIMKIQAAYAAFPGLWAIPTARVKTMAAVQAGLVLSQPWVPRYAEGTGNHPGGSALVGEEGPEIVNLPRGSSVIPHKQSMAALNNQGTTYNFVFNNPVVDNNDRMEDLVDTIERRLGSRMRGIA